MFRQSYSFMELFLSKYQCGFSHIYGAQYCLLAMIEKRNETGTKRNGTKRGLQATHMTTHPTLRQVILMVLLNRLKRF